MVKYSVVESEIIIGQVMTWTRYDRIMEKSNEYLAAEWGLGPYVRFGLSDIHGTLTMAIGEW